MENLARLRVARLVMPGRLRGGQVAEHAARERRVHPLKLQRGDDAVPSERRAEPWHAGVWIEAFRTLGHHHGDIRGRSVEPFVELVVRAGNPALLRPQSRLCGARVFERIGVRRRHTMDLAGLAGDGHVEERRVAGVQFDRQRQDSGADRQRRRLADDRCPPQDAVESPVTEDQMVTHELIAQPLAAPLPCGAAHLEDVGEIRVGVNRNGRPHARLAIVGDLQALETGAVPQKRGFEDVQDTFRQLDTAVAGRADRGSSGRSSAAIGPCESWSSTAARAARQCAARSATGGACQRDRGRTRSTDSTADRRIDRKRRRYRLVSVHGFGRQPWPGWRGCRTGLVR